MRCTGVLVLAAASLIAPLTSPLVAMDRGGSEDAVQPPDPGRIVAVGTVRPSAAELVELGRLGIGDAVVVSDWDLGAGVAPLVLRRIEVYDPDARIFAVTATGLAEVPRSVRRHFLGETVDGSDTRVMLSLDPGTDALRGVVRSRGEVLELVPAGDPDGDGRYLLARGDELVAARDGSAPSWDCGLHETPDASFEASPPASPQVGPKALPSLHTAVIAVDTDNELMLQKFSDSTSAASDYIADLIAAMNVMYERDLNVRLLQGTTFLRVSTIADPYVQTSTVGANSAQLNEFGNYWKSHYSAVNRALAMMLSGKSSSPYSASGIAWIGGLCSTSYGYSFSQVFKIDYLSGDAKLVGHELGHNFGSQHTHCYSPPIDQCSNQCYDITPTCPPGGAGTIMSYCHLLGGCASTMNFHARVIAVIDGYTSAATCVEEAVPPDYDPPVISDAAADPRITTAGHTIVLAATIVDALSGVDDAEARVRDGGGTLRATVPLSDAGGDLWSGNLSTTGLSLGGYTVDIAAEDSSVSHNSTTAVAAASFELRSTFACNLDLTGETVTGTESWEVCGTITAAPAFVVTGTGHAAVTAGLKVVVRNGLVVQSGGSLEIGVDPLLQQ